MKKIKEMIKEMNKTLKKVLVGTSVLLTAGVEKATAAPLSLPGMNDVTSSLQNFIGYAATLFIAGGAAAALWGGYTFFQGIRSQDGEAKHKATLEIGAGLGAIAVGIAAATFKGYIVLQ